MKIPIELLHSRWATEMRRMRLRLAKQADEIETLLQKPHEKNRAETVPSIGN